MNSDDPIAFLNEVLSEVIDEIMAIKQARRAVPDTHALHRVLDRLLADLQTWKEHLIERDLELGVSPLAVMPSAAGRHPANLWPHGADDDDVRRTIKEHIDRLEHHVRSALAEQSEESRAPLAEMQHGLLVNKRALAGSVDPV
jgi:DNA-binding ferritin-like protein